MLFRSIHHLGPFLDDAAPLRITSYHEAVDVVEENQRNQVFIAVHDKACSFFGGFCIDNSAELHALVALVVGLLRMKLLIGNNSHRKSADTRVTADDCLSVLDRKST